MEPLRREKTKCSKCGREIPIDTQPSEHWQYFCADCGLQEALKEIKESKGFYDEKSISD